MFPQLVLENPAQNWRLLLEVFIEARQFNPATAGIEGFLTEEGKSKLQRSLREMVESANCPIITAWDPERQKVRNSINLHVYVAQVPPLLLILCEVKYSRCHSCHCKKQLQALL